LGKSVLIAEPRELLRKGLMAVFREDERVARVYETMTHAGLKSQLNKSLLDLVVVNQSLIEDVTILPKGNFVIITSQPDVAMLQASFKHGARGYVSENISIELLKMALSPSQESFLIEPTLAPRIMEWICREPQYAIIAEELLTPREREIISLLRRGIGRSSIAKQLCITEATLKTHIKNIYRKRKEHSSRVLPGVS